MLSGDVIMDKSFNSFKERIIKPLTYFALPIIMASCSPSTDKVSEHYHVKDPSIVGWNKANKLLLDDINEDGRIDVVYIIADNTAGTSIVKAYDPRQISKDDLRRNFNYVPGDVKTLNTNLVFMGSREHQAEKMLEQGLDSLLYGK